MENTYWLKQTDKPLFPEVMWSRPENRRNSGKLLIVGGNSHGFSDVSTAYGQALSAGAGSIRLFMPDALSRSVSRLMPEAEFGPSSPSGSFSGKALSQLIELSEWSDGVLLAGDFGKNSEVAVLLEKFTDKYTANLCIAGDGVDYFFSKPVSVRTDTCLVTSVPKLQKLASGSGQLIRQSAELLELVRELHEWSIGSKLAIVTHHAGQSIVAYQGTVSTTRGSSLGPGSASVWQLQQPTRLFEALCCAAFESDSDTRHKEN